MNDKPGIRRTLIGTAAAVLVTTVSMSTASASAPEESTGERIAGAVGSSGRVGSWAASPQRPRAGFEHEGPNWSQAGFSSQSVRQVVRLSSGGKTARIRLSNRYGSSALRLTGATIAKTSTGAAIKPESLRPLTFGHRLSATIPAGADIASDDVYLPTRPLETLTVTLYFAGSTGPATFHSGGRATAYRATGNHLYDPSGSAYSDNGTTSRYYLTAVEVGAGAARDTVVAFGDSLTDGSNSGTDVDNRFPDELAERLVASHRNLAVANTGIDGNRVLSDASCFGDSALHRFQRDVLRQPAVRTVIVFEGVNDIGSGGVPDIFGCGLAPTITADDLIAGHRELIRAAHARGVRIIGATIGPIKGSFYDDSAEPGADNEQIRDAVNHWIRTSGEYDSVVDFAAVLADPNDPSGDTINPDYNGGDNLHPNDTGMKALAAAIDLGKL